MEKQNRRMFKSIDGKRMLVVVDVEEQEEDGFLVYVGYEVAEKQRVWIRPQYYREVEFEGIAYTREEVIEKLLEDAKRKRANSQGYWANEKLKEISKFIEGEVVIVESESSYSRGFECVVDYMSDGTVKRACYSAD